MSKFLLSLFAGFLSVFSWKRIQTFGKLLGIIWFSVIRIRRGTVLQNLEAALPQYREQHLTIACETFQNVCISTLELLKMRQMDAAAILEKTTTVGFAHFERCFAQKKGVIVVTGHFGNFDLLACSQALQGIPLGIVSRQLQTKGSNSFWMETRRNKGLKIFIEKVMARSILKWVLKGNVIGIVVDQRTKAADGGICVPFLGQPAWTSTAAARLALRTGAPLLPVHIERDKNGNHVVLIDEAIEFDKNGNDEKSVETITCKINKILEKWIVNKPAHWMWLHRRFKEYTK